MGGQRHAPDALHDGKTRYPMYGGLGRPQGRSGRVRKFSPPPPGFDPWTVQSVASRYTDYIRVSEEDPITSGEKKKSQDYVGPMYTEVCANPFRS